MSTKRTAANKKQGKSPTAAKNATRGATGPGTTLSLETLLAVLGDAKKPSKTRLRALQSLGAAQFAVPDFASIHGDYIATLRKVVEDSNLELRQRVLGILAREKDGFAQKRLLEGLQEPDKALVSPEKALQLLSYDVHADAYPVARAIVNNPPNPIAKREALRLLAADTASTPTFEKILRDKNEPLDVRQVSATALHALKPERLQEHARAIVMDPNEHVEMQQTCLTALTQFGAGQLATDKPLLNRVGVLSTKAPTEVQRSAREFLGKYRR